MSLRLDPIVAPNAEQIDQLHAVCCQAPNYWLLTEGKRMPAREAVAAWFDGSELPPGRSILDQDIFGICVEEQMVGVTMVLRGWRYPEQAMIGLLLLAEPWQGRGLGRRVYRRLEQDALRWPGIAVMRIGIVASNAPAFPFWYQQGFVETGERKRDLSFLADTVMLEKRLMQDGPTSAAEIAISGLK